MQVIYCDGGVIGKNPSDHGGVWAWRLVDDSRVYNSVLYERSGVLEPPTAGEVARSSIDHAVEYKSANQDVAHHAFLGSEGVGFRCSNNHSEMWAVLDALAHRPDGWSGVLVTDSAVTIKRLQPDTLLNAKDVPMEFILLIAEMHRRLGQVELRHVKGHPTRADLKAGHRNGMPVSRHQVWCDQECTRLHHLVRERMRSMEAAVTMWSRLMTTNA